MPKLAWVVAPLALYALIIAVLALRGRVPGRLALNVHTSLLLLAYLLTTAGLGIFWVANQQLPVFDWHYLFGYATVLLVALHLSFNLPVVLRWFSRPKAPASGGAALVGKALAIAAAVALAYFVGSRQGGGAALPASATGNPIVAYHEFSSESRSSVFRRAPGVDWGDPPPPFKRYPGAPTIALEKGTPGQQALADMLRAPAAAPPAFRLADLGRVLFLASGVTQRRGGHALRAAPSSGALFPSELYVVARRVDGLKPGLYHYDPDRHLLHALGPVADTGDAEALVVLSAVFRRTGYKYRNRAYRYALADAGHLLENLRLGAHGAGMHASLLPQFDDAQAARTVGIDGVEEGVLAIMALRRTSVAAQPTGDAFIAVAASASPIGVTGAVHRATSLQQVAAAAAGPLMSLPAPERAGSDMYSIIAKRRSQRRFSDAPLPLGGLSSLLADMAQQAQLSGAVSVSVVVSRVAGLAPGVYRYLPGHALQLVRAGQFADQARSAALSQDVIGDAAAVLVLSAARDQVLSPGPRGYRHALLEAGLMGERWLLGAVARRLAACPVGAFYDDEAAALIGVDGSRHWVLHFAALGVPAAN